MGRRKAFLAALALCGGVAVSMTPLASAAPATPVQCPPHQLVTQSDGNFYVWLPNPDPSTSCWISVEVPGNIQKPPPPAATQSPSMVYPPQPCPTHVLITQSDGNYYVWLPNPTGQTCWISIEIPVGTTVQYEATPVPGPNGCTTQPIAYESDGHDYVMAPDPNSSDPCRTYMELPVTVPPTL
jgi:hypothetical protein